MPVAIVERQYPFPYRTRKSSSLTPMILHFCGKVGSCRLFCFNAVKTKKPKHAKRATLLLLIFPRQYPAKVHLSMRMSFLISFNQLFCSNVRISLCCRNTRMPQKLLNYTNVTAIRKKLRCKSMTESMRIHVPPCSFNTSVA